MSGDTVYLLDASGTYSEITPLGSTADGGYSANVQTSGTDVTNGACGYPPNTGSSTSSIDLSGNVEAADYPALSLVTDDSGETLFTPRFLAMPEGNWTWSESCEGTSGSGMTQIDSGVLTFGLRYGDQIDAESPLADTDPDPLHLVGERTWTIGDWPHEPLLDPEEYSFTVNYDLRLVDPCTNSNVTQDVYRADLGADDILEFELRTVWCTSPGGLTVVDVEARGATLTSPFDAAVERVIREVTTYHNKWTTEVVQSGGPDLTVVTGTGRWKDCWGIPMPLKAKRLDVIASLFRKAAKRVHNDVVRYAMRKFADLLEKAANKLDSATRWVVRQILEGATKLIKKLPDRAQRKITKLILYVIADDYTSKQWARDYVRSMPSEKLISKLLGDELSCRTVWIPRVVHRLSADNTSTSKYVDLDADSDAWHEHRVGGSS